MIASLVLIATAGLANPQEDLAGPSEKRPAGMKVGPRRWRLVWADEFDKGPRPDPTVWSYEEGYVRNREAQYYTVDRRENARVENGRLIIEARRDGWQGHRITSASLHTSGKKSILYGRIEVRAKIPTGRGTWPAIWTLGENIESVGWPACGEIDIMENVGFDPRRIHAHVHTEAYNGLRGNAKGASTLAAAPWQRFHVYALEWYPDRLEFFFDGTRYFVYRNEGTGEAAWPFDKAQYLILNLAIGGEWGGAQGIDEALFPHRFEIDYVRVFERRR